MKHSISNVDALRYLALKRCCGKLGRCSANEKNVAYICEQYRQSARFRALVDKTLQEEHKCKKQTLPDSTTDSTADRKNSTEQASRNHFDNLKSVNQANNSSHSSKGNECVYSPNPTLSPKKHKRHYISASDIARYLKLANKPVSKRKGYEMVRFKYSYYAEYRALVDATLLADKEKSTKQLVENDVPKSPVIPPFTNSNNQVSNQQNTCLNSLTVNEEIRNHLNNCTTTTNPKQSENFEDLSPSSLSNNSKQISKTTTKPYISAFDIYRFTRLKMKSYSKHKGYTKVRYKYLNDALFRELVDATLAELDKNKEVEDKEMSANQARNTLPEDPVASSFTCNNQEENQVNATNEESLIPSSSFAIQQTLLQSQAFVDLNHSSLSNPKKQRSTKTRKHFISRPDVFRYLKLKNIRRSKEKSYFKIRDKYNKDAEFRASVDSILFADREKSAKQVSQTCPEDSVTCPISNNNEVENPVNNLQSCATDEESLIPSSSFAVQQTLLQSQAFVDLNHSLIFNSNKQRSTKTRKHFISRPDVFRYLKLKNIRRSKEKSYFKIRDKYNKDAKFRASVDSTLLADREKSAKQASQTGPEDSVTCRISSNNEVENPVNNLQCFATNEESLISSPSCAAQPTLALSDLDHSLISNTSDQRSRITRKHFVSKSDVARYLKLRNISCSIKKGYQKIRDKYNKDAEFRALVDVTLLKGIDKASKQSNIRFSSSNKNKKIMEQGNEHNCDVYQLRNRAAPKTIQPITKNFSNLEISLFDICQYLMLKRGPTFKVTIRHIEDTLKRCTEDRNLCAFVSKTVQEKKYQASDDPSENNFLTNNPVQASLEDPSLLHPAPPVSKTISEDETTHKFRRISRANARLYIMLKCGTADRISRQNIERVRAKYQSDETYRNAVLHMFQDVDGQGTNCFNRLLQDVSFHLLGKGKANSAANSQEVGQRFPLIATVSPISKQPDIEQRQVAAQSNASSFAEPTYTPPKKRRKIVLEISKHNSPTKLQQSSFTGTPQTMDILSQAVEVLNVPEASSFMTLQPHGQLQQQIEDVEDLRLPVIDDGLSNETPEVSDGEVSLTPEVSDGEVTPYYSPSKESSPQIVEIGFNEVDEQANLNDLVDMDASYALNSTSESAVNELDDCQVKKKVEIDYLDDRPKVSLLDSRIKHCGLNAMRKVRRKRTIQGDDSDCEAVTLDCPAGGSFQFPRDVWETCKRSRVRRQFKDGSWRSVILKNIKSFNPVCAFIFNRHYVCDARTYRKNRLSPMFYCMGYCNFSVCNNEFQVKLNADLTAHVQFVGTVRHKPHEDVANRLTTQERRELKEILKTTSVEEYEKFRMASLTPEEIAVGNRNGCPSRDLLNMIRNQSLREVLKEANRQLVATMESEGHDWPALEGKKEHQRKKFFHKPDESEESDDSEQNESFFRHPTPTQGRFTFSREVWERCRRTKDKRRLVTNEWAVEVRSKLKELNNMCSFCFTCHFVRREDSQRPAQAPLLTCTGYCRFPTCSVRFHVAVDHQLEAFVRFKGRLKHRRNETYMHCIRGVERDRLRQILMTTSVTDYFNEQLKKLTQKEIDSGCRDRCPSKVVLKQIRAESIRLMKEQR